MKSSFGHLKALLSRPDLQVEKVQDRKLSKHFPAIFESTNQDGDDDILQSKTTSKLCC